MKKIFIVDKASMGILKDHRWNIDTHGYLVRYSSSSGKKITVSFHREVMGAAKGTIVDHKNGNTLDNRASNLRFCTHVQNMQNRRTHKNNKSGFKGVYFDGSQNSPKKWRSQIRVFGKKIGLGCFDTPEAASASYAIAAAKYHGEFSRVA